MDRFERFSAAISEISRHWHRIASDEMEKYGLKGAHSVYLTTLYRCPEGMTAGRLCALCGKDKSDVSRMAAAMEKKGLMCKAGGHQNAYGGRLQLTEAGRAVAERVQRRASLAVELAGAGLGEEKREALYEALEQIAVNLREIAREGLPEGEEGSAERQSP